jgi:hypothetical protein
MHNTKGFDGLRSHLQVLIQQAGHYQLIECAIPLTPLFGNTELLHHLDVELKSTDQQSLSSRLWIDRFFVYGV